MPAPFRNCVSYSIRFISPVRAKVSAEEWQARIDLAVCYQRLARYNMAGLTDTHTSLSVPGSDNKHFLINPHGVLFERVTASSLVKIDWEGNPVMETPYRVNPAGFIIHSAIHMARPDAACVMHTHTTARKWMAELSDYLDRTEIALAPRA